MFESMGLTQYTVQMNRYNNPDKVAAPALQSTRLLDQVRERIRYLHYSLQTEKAFLLAAGGTASPLDVLVA
jgi:hypothetical protein